MYELLSVMPQNKLDRMYEVVDKWNRPLCVMGMDEILRQKLTYRACGLLLRNGHGSYLLRAGTGGQFGFSFFGPVPAGRSGEEVCLQAMMSFFSDNTLDGAGLKFCGQWLPCPENGGAFTNIYLAPLSMAWSANFAMDQDKYLLADKYELAALITREYNIDPLLCKMLENGMLNV